MNCVLRFLILTAAWFPWLAAAEPLVVVVNPGSGIFALSRDEVVDIFFGRNRQFASGVGIRAVDLPPGHPVRADFYRRLVSKSPAEIKAYWTRLSRPARAVQPIQTQAVDEAVKALQRMPGAIGYLERHQVSAPLTVVLELAD